MDLDCGVTLLVASAWLQVRMSCLHFWSRPLLVLSSSLFSTWPPEWADQDTNTTKSFLCLQPSAAYHHLRDRIRTPWPGVGGSSWHEAALLFHPLLLPPHYGIHSLPSSDNLLFLEWGCSLLPRIFVSAAPLAWHEPPYLLLCLDNFYSSLET